MTAPRVQGLSLRDRLFFAALDVRKLPHPELEFRFHAPRKWRMDFCWPDRKIGCEVDGGVWVKGRHTRGAGWLADTEKLNHCALLGYRMLRTTPQDLLSRDFLNLLERVLTEVTP